MEDWIDLKGRVVIVTGASSGIGSHIAAGLAKLGAKVVGADLSEPEKGAAAYFVRCDITKRADVERMVETAYARFGRIDALVNNAGVNRPRLLVDAKEAYSKYELSDADYDFMMNVDVRGVVLVSQAVVRKMIGSGGVIVNISSTSGKPGSQGQSIYAAAKAAVNSLTRSFAKELGRYGIRVVAVTPGIHESTALSSSDAYLDALAYTRGITRDKINDGYVHSIPLGRVGRLDEIVDLVCYLISDRASYITGTVVNVSGGKTTD